jgi:uncharacterized delta-60 repeat protein
MLFVRSAAAATEGLSMRRRVGVLAGSLCAATVLAVLASAAASDLDQAFGTGGRVTTDFGTPAAAHALAPALGGKFVAAGGAGDDFALARYLPDGTLDTSFDGDGRLTTDIGGEDVANGVVVQPNGKIVAVGASDGDFALKRYRGGGKFDVPFGQQGEVTTDLGGDDAAFAVVRMADGRFVVVGSSGQDFAVVRYTFKGDLDSTFGVQGKVVTDLGGPDRAEAVVLQSDGKIVVAGRSGGDFALARYESNGTLDSTFGGDGVVTTDFAGNQDAALAVAVQPNAEIVAAGTTASGGSSDFALARYLPDGSLDVSLGPTDPGFSGDGMVTTDFGGTDPEGATAVAIQQNNRIVAVGGALADLVVARYDFDGTPDPSFGVDGKLTTDFTGADVGQALALQADGKIVVAGTTSAGGGDFALARYGGDFVPGAPGTAPASP